MRSSGPVVLFLVLVLSGCTGGAEGSSSISTAISDPVAVQGTTTTQPCEPEITPLTLEQAPDPTPLGLLALSREVYFCMPAAVVVQGEDLATVRFGAETAIEQGIPLLQLGSAADVAAVATELERLEVTEVIAVGVEPALSAALGESVRSEPLPTTTTSPPTTSPPTTSPPTTQPATEDSDAEPISTLVDSSTTSSDVAEGSTTTTAITATTIPARPEFDPPPSTPAAHQDGPVLVYRPEELVDAYLALPAISAGGGEVVVGDLNDVDGLRAVLAGRTKVFSGGDPGTATEKWQLALAASDTELFGGGTTVFPDRRIVAYYGNPLTFRLGILGETNPERAVERVTERAALYDAEGLPPVIPGFEIIATVASNRAGDDGNYSNEMDLETIRPWVDVATANDVSVILDLQPGRTDFLTQAKLYEDFLRMPNVGLALDPEWRLKPDQRHLRQIGSVSAEEINAVVDYLASLVREETLPQKVLILHQFQERMLPEREQVKTPPEIAVVVHVDGQGSLGSKYGTWNAMLNATSSPDQELWWAWKNFIDEDFPTATPGQVNAVEPLPVIVTYQ